MSSPENSAPVLAINALLDERAELEVRISQIADDLQTAALRLAAIEDRSERLRIVRHLYWRRPEINVYALCAALLIEWDHDKDAPKRGWDINLRDFMRFSKSLREMVGPYGHRDCATDDCDGTIPINSRTQLYNPSGFREEFMCERCVAAQHEAARDQRWLSRGRSK